MKQVHAMNATLPPQMIATVTVSTCQALRAEQKEGSYLPDTEPGPWG